MNLLPKIATVILLSHRLLDGWDCKGITALFGIFSLTGNHLVHGLVLTAPPNVRLALGQEQSLRRECEASTAAGHQSGVSNMGFVWEPTIQNCNYELVTHIFDGMLAASRRINETAPYTTTTVIWLPKLSFKSDDSLHRLTRILNENKRRLGGFHVEAATWPQTPATRLTLSRPVVVRTDTSYSDGSDGNSDSQHTTSRRIDNDSIMSISSALAATEMWVQEKLCGMALCPYTSSLTRAAVGLEGVGVHEGPIQIRHSCLSEENASNLPAPLVFGNVINDDQIQQPPPPALQLSLGFWKGVTELVTSREKDVATLLILAPRILDDDFVEFVAIFDDLLEPIVQVTGSDNEIGRALFHPLYSSFQIGHETVVAGHALPATMVEQFLDKYYYSSDQTDRSSKDSLAANDKPTMEEISRANDAVRWTPHATINLLRRSQLNAAKESEAVSANKKPNLIYARNVIRMLKIL
jgi:hypothetical protein